MASVNELPIVSIVIPCYNHGRYIDETIKSIEQVKDKHLYEIIIINDGSTEEFTNQRLQQLSSEGYNVIFQKNSGLAATRNNGIKIARGEYILPLDADNKIRPAFLYKGIETLTQHPDVSIVYGNAALFGDQEGVKSQGAYNLQKLMLGNYIDACCMFRKEVWIKTGGYDHKMPAQGVEDWELWLHASFLGFKFHYIDEILFDYRVLNSSMIHDLKKSKIKGDAIIDYMSHKHPSFFGPKYVDENIMSKFKASPAGFIGKLFLKGFFPRFFQKKVGNGTLRKYI